jgi:hypothetical protein
VYKHKSVTTQRVKITNEALQAIGVDGTDFGQLHLDQQHPTPHPNASAITLFDIPFPSMTRM